MWLIWLADLSLADLYLHAEWLVEMKSSQASCSVLFNSFVWEVGERGGGLLWVVGCGNLLKGERVIFASG